MCYSFIVTSATVSYFMEFISELPSDDEIKVEFVILESSAV